MTARAAPRRRPRRPALLAAVALAATGCAGAPDWRPITVELRDAADGAPVAGAEVSVRGRWLFWDSISAEPLDGSAGPGPSGRSDDRGIVRLAAPKGRAFDLRVLVPWREPYQTTFARHPAAAGEGEAVGWITLDGADDPTLELRVVAEPDD